MLQSSDNLLYTVKLHLASNCQCASSDQCCVASFVRRDGDDGQVGTRSVALSHKLLAFTVVKVVI
jgi:hypothetical protein